MPDIRVARSGRRFAARSTHPGYGIPARGPINAKAEIRSFADARTFLDGDAEREVASHVTVVLRTGTPESPESIAVRLYDTDIITYHADETFGFRNGGYFTPTTSARANQFGPEAYHFSNKNLLLHAGGTPEREGQRIPVVPRKHWMRDQNPQ